MKSHCTFIFASPQKCPMNVFNYLKPALLDLQWKSDNTQRESYQLNHNTDSYLHVYMESVGISLKVHSGCVILDFDALAADKTPHQRYIINNIYRIVKDAYKSLEYLPILPINTDSNICMFIHKDYPTKETSIFR